MCWFKRLYGRLKRGSSSCLVMKVSWMTYNQWTIDVFVSPASRATIWYKQYLFSIIVVPASRASWFDCTIFTGLFEMFSHKPASRTLDTIVGFKNGKIGGIMIKWWGMIFTGLFEMFWMNQFIDVNCLSCLNRVHTFVGRGLFWRRRVG